MDGTDHKLRTAVGVLLLLAAALLAFALTQASGAVASSSLPSRECQHPLTTGQEAVDIKNVAPKTACKVVRKLARLIENGEKPGRLYRCAGLTKQHPGRPVLVIHSFDGWRLKIVKTYGLKLYSGDASFGVTGTDFPLNCT